MNDLSGFAKIATYLTHPLVLVGFVLMMVFGIHRQMMKSGILPEVSQKASSEILKTILRYGFWIGLAILILGFILQILSA